MNIVLATDNNFVQHCAVTIVSILKNNENVSLFLLTEHISDDNAILLSKLVETCGGQLQILYVKSDIVRQFPMPREMAAHISIATYYRLFVSMLVPQYVTKIIYLDSDIVVRRSLLGLWNIDIDNYALGAVYQQNEWSIIDNSFERLGYSERYGYFNAGVLLINLEYWRKNKVAERLFSFIRESYNRINSHDQDTLNAVLHKETKGIDCTWNFLTAFFEETVPSFHFPDGMKYLEEIIKIKENPNVIHFVFRPKPWEYACNHPFRDEYFYYLSFTPWKNWTPEFNIKNLFIYKSFPALLKIRRKLLRLLGLR